MSECCWSTLLWNGFIWHEIWFFSEARRESVWLLKIGSWPLVHEMRFAAYNEWVLLEYIVMEWIYLTWDLVFFFTKTRKESVWLLKTGWWLLVHEMRFAACNEWVLWIANCVDCGCRVAWHRWRVCSWAYDKQRLTFWRRNYFFYFSTSCM